MPALTQAYEAYQKPTILVSYKVAATTTIYKGALVATSASGFLVPINNTVANQRFVGIAEETVVNSGADGDQSCRVAKGGGGVYSAAIAATQADVGKEVYAKTDNEVQVPTTGLVNLYKVGTIVGLETTGFGSPGVRIRIDNYSV